ncbi:MAG: hypothetical protein LBU39_11120 [Desulfobulbaceae bacterium]|jgi:hypothetical protein|nr:hypothetical protein [Desulfobulbaceae bacterium]
MSDLTLSATIAEKLATLYQEMEHGYDRVAANIGLTCAGCPDNCCDSYFLHHTYLEWAYLWRGLQTLAPSALEAAIARARLCLAHYREAEEAEQWPSIMCPLNQDGLCVLYLHRPMICRCHGVPARLRRQDGRALHFPGCFRCQELTARPGRSASQAAAIVQVDRTPLLRRLARLEDEFLDDQRGLLPRLKMTLADMLVVGPLDA